MENKIEVSEELKELYNLLVKLDTDGKSSYHYLRFIVQNSHRDYLGLLLNVLKEMIKKGYNFD